MKDLKEKLKNGKIYWVYDYHLALKYDKDGEKLKSLTDSGFIDILQFRGKTINEPAFIEWVRELLPKTNRQKTLVLANDFVESVPKLKLDGVHVGQSDMPLSLARKILGEQYIIGVTARSLEQMKNGELNGADYVGAGTVFPTETKEGLTAKGPEFIAELISNSKIPIFPIGGITLENLPKLTELNIKKVALASCLIVAENPIPLANKIHNMLI